MNSAELRKVLEAVLFANDEPISLNHLCDLVRAELDQNADVVQEVQDALGTLQRESSGRGVELIEVASGYRFQVPEVYSRWLQKQWQRRPPKYSRALLETLALIAYRQPITRGGIEEIRGVSASSHIIRTLIDRGWVRKVGEEQKPGRPELLGTTPAFLDYFNLRSLDELPPVEEVQLVLASGIESEDSDGDWEDSEAAAEIEQVDQVTDE